MMRSTLGLAAFVAAGLPAALAAESQKVPVAAPAKAPAQAAPKSTTATQASTSKPAEPTSWSLEEIAAAKSRCSSLLASVDAVVIPEPPMRAGSCGAPAPMRLITIGKNPEVALSPPAVLSCEMIAALAQWVKNDIQPLAKKHLGAPVIKIENMSDYSCRAAYGRIGNKLSEHGRANALDIRGFITASGQPTMVLAEWGKTARDIAREIAAAKAAAEKAKASAAAPAPAAAPAVAAAKPAAPQLAAPVPAPVPSGEDIAQSAIDTVKNLFKGTIFSGPEPAQDDPAGHALVPASRLGGPKDAAPPAAEKSLSPNPAIASSRKSRFLREAHASACRTFGTTLGPEANEAHRNHFHIDMAVRNIGKYCR